MAQLTAVHHGVAGLIPGEGLPGHLAGLVAVPAQECAQARPSNLLELGKAESSQIVVPVLVPKPDKQLNM